MTTDFTKQQLNQFASEQWPRAKAWMRKNFPVLSDDDLGDVFQEAFLTLYDNIRTGKLSELTSSLSSYFFGICKYKALERIKARKKDRRSYVYVSIELVDDEIQDDKIKEIMLTSGVEETLNDKEADLVRQMVRSMPEPCNRLLWGYYWDNFSLKSLAMQLGYTAGSIKVKAMQCRDKFRRRYNELIKRLR